MFDLPEPYELKALLAHLIPFTEFRHQEKGAIKFSIELHYRQQKTKTNQRQTKEFIYNLYNKVDKMQVIFIYTDNTIIIL